MPDEIKDTIEPKINEFFEIHNNHLKEALKQLDIDVERIIYTNIDPLKLSTDYLIKYKGNPINNDLNKEIRKYLQNKVKVIVSKINDSLNESKIEQVISVHIPQLMSYMNDRRLAEYIFHEFNEH